MATQDPTPAPQDRDALLRWSSLSDAEVLTLAPAFGNFSRDELEAFCAGFRRCALVLSGASIDASSDEDRAKWTHANLVKLGLAA